MVHRLPKYVHKICSLHLFLDAQFDWHLTIKEYRFVAEVPTFEGMIILQNKKINQNETFSVFLLLNCRFLILFTYKISHDLHLELTALIAASKSSRMMTIIKIYSLEWMDVRTAEGGPLIFGYCSDGMSIMWLFLVKWKLKTDSMKTDAN